jgi:hypothetical protein
MWSKTALAAAVLLLAATPEVLHVVKAAPEPVRPPPVAVSQAPSDTRFKPVCRGDEVLDSRPDPAWVRQSFDKDNCRAPLLPAALDGTKATRTQVVSAMDQAKRYAAMANEFQRCVSDFVAAKRAQAARGGTPLTPSQVIIENHRILVSQRAAQTAVAQVRVAINEFNSYGSDCAE